MKKQEVIHGFNTKGDYYICLDGMTFKHKLKVIRSALFKGRVAFCIYKDTMNEIAEEVNKFNKESE